MKRFKRTDKDATPNTPASSRRVLLPGLLCSLLGVAAAGALLWAVQAHYLDQQRTQLLNLLGQQQTAALNQALQRLQADTQAAASNPELLDALRSADPEEFALQERRLTHWHGVIDAHLNRRGEANQRPQRAAPVSFAALDLLRRAEAGQNPPPEAFRVGQRWLLYSVAALRPGEGQPARGTLLMVFDLERLLSALPPLPDDVAQVTVEQIFTKGQAQRLLQRGQADDSGSALRFATQNPHWQVQISAGSHLTPDSLPPLLLALAALLALAGAGLGLVLLQGGLNQRVNRDALQLSAMVKEIASGKRIKAFSLSVPALDALAKALSHLPGRTAAAPNAQPAPVGRPEPAATELVNPLFQDTDIFDIDILEQDQDLLGLEPSSAMTTSNRAPALPADIFRAYDIRGVVGRTLTPEYAYWIGRAIGSQSLAQGEDKVIVGRDGRLSGPELLERLTQGLVDCGCQVTDVGMVPTPVVYFAANVLEGRSAVMLTGSHNPPDYNGFKIIIAGDTLANEQIQALKQRLDNNDLASGQGSVQQVDVLDQYLQTVRDDIAMAKPLRVVVDCGNGAAGIIAPQLIEALGCSVIPLFCEVDGNFPNHHPDPGKPENLVDLIARVKAEKADLGLAFDGDGDRVGVVTNEGNIVFPDKLLMLFAKDVVSRNPGADIIFDVKCTRRLIPLISGYGGRPVMWKTGHSLIKKKMKETGALLAGEMSGHIFFKERWYGFDDGIYSAARLLEILSLETRCAEQVFNAFPSDISTPEINIQVTEETKFSLIERLQREAQWGDAKLTDIDGVRVDYPKGWGLIRASNTTPVLVLRFEADTEDELERIKQVFRQQLSQVAPDLSLPF